MSTSYPGALDSYTPEVALGTNPTSGFSSVGAALVSLGDDLEAVEAGVASPGTSIASLNDELDVVSASLSASGGTRSGDLDMGSHPITNQAEPRGDSVAARPPSHPAAGAPGPS